MDNLKQGMVSIFMSYVARGEPVLVRGPKERFRDFVSVHDVVDAFYRAAVDSRACGRIYNVATGRKTCVGELIEKIVCVFGHDPSTYPITMGEPTRQDQFGVYGDASRLRSDLGWSPRIVLEDGLREMADWVRNGGQS
jgi:UDP-glucose 4-epimerase